MPTTTTYPDCICCGGGGCPCAASMPGTLYATIFGTGNCDGTWELTETGGGSGIWVYDGALGSCETGLGYTLQFQCDPDTGQWLLYTDGAANGPYSGTFSGTCEAFSILFSSVISSCCDSDFDVTVTR